MPSNDNTPKAKRGFAVMDQARQREIASMGGRTAHARGTAHEFAGAKARDAGRKGGLARAKRLAEKRAAQQAAAQQAAAQQAAAQQGATP